MTGQLEVRSARRQLTDGWAVGVLVAVVGVLTAVHLAVGSGYVLDDWYAYRNTRFDGWAEAADGGLGLARPGSKLTFGLAFGFAGDNQAAMVLIRYGLVLAAAVLGYLVLRRFVRRDAALACMALWLVLPNHMSLEYWPSALVASVSVVALLGALLLIADRQVRPIRLLAACACTALSVLTYESSYLPAAVAAVALPWLCARRLQWRVVVAIWATLAASALWMLTHWTSVKSVHNDASGYRDVFQAHFGWGVFRAGPFASVMLLAGLLGAVVVVARVARPSSRPSAGPADWLVCAGLAVMVLGSVTFVLYYYAPIGAGDRVSYLSSMGGAMVVVGLLWLLAQHARAVAVVLAVVIVAGALMARAERTELWATATADADRIVEALAATDSSCTTVYLGPAPIQRQNVVAFLDASNVDGAVQVAVGRRDVKGVMTYDQATFDAAPEGCRVDLRPLSRLTPDSAAGPT